MAKGVCPLSGLTGSRSGSDGCFERALAPGRAKDYGEAFGPVHAVPHALLLL